MLDAWTDLPPWARAEAPAPGPARLCHGDFHLGQLIRDPAPGSPWLLIDVDDLGAGPPVWDLARPAAWYAVGMLDPDAWHRFLTAYRARLAPAVPPDGDPWPELDVPARALTAQTAARAVTKAAAAGLPAGRGGGVARRRLRPHAVRNGRRPGLPGTRCPDVGCNRPTAGQSLSS